MIYRRKNVPFREDLNCQWVSVQVAFSIFFLQFRFESLCKLKKRVIRLHLLYILVDQMACKVILIITTPLFSTKITLISCDTPCYSNSIYFMKKTFHEGFSKMWFMWINYFLTINYCTNYYHCHTSLRNFSISSKNIKRNRKIFNDSNLLFMTVKIFSC